MKTFHRGFDDVHGGRRGYAELEFSAIVGGGLLFFRFRLIAQLEHDFGVREREAGIVKDGSFDYGVSGIFRAGSKYTGAQQENRGAGTEKTEEPLAAVRKRTCSAP
jgi:hypothetical protein